MAHAGHDIWMVTGKIRHTHTTATRVHIHEYDKGTIQHDKLHGCTIYD